MKQIKQVKKIIKAIFFPPFSIILIAAMGIPAAAASIEFTVDDIVTSRDFADLMLPISRVTPLEGERYKPLGAAYLVQDLDLLLNSGDEYRIMLVCGKSAPSGALQDIQLLVVDDRKDSPNVLQRIKLGDGEAPQLLRPNDVPDFEDIMVRVIRTGNNSESYVYSVNRAAGNLMETLKIDRSFPERIKLSVGGRMQPDGFIEVESKNPPVMSVIDMSAALDALVEDGLYQQNGRPVPSQANLVCVRNGWEDERIYLDDGSDRVEMLEIGLSLITSARKQVVNVLVTMTKAEGNKWMVRDINFEPFLPYRW